MRDALATPQSKNEGTFSMFNIRSVAQNHAIISNNVEIVNDNWSLDTAAGIYLDEKAKDYGMTRHYAQYATGLVTFTGTDGTTIPGGTIVAAPDYGVRFVTQESAIISQGTATAKPVNVSATVTLGSTGNLETVKAGFTEALKAYFQQIAYDGETISVSPARVGNLLFAVQGVVDYANLTLNGGTAAVTIGEEEVLQVGTITLNLPTGGS